MLGTFLAMCCCCFGVVGSAGQEFYPVPTIVKQTMEDAHKAGLALSDKDLEPVPFPSDASNMAPLLANMGKDLTAVENHWAQNDQVMFTQAAKGAVQDVPDLENLLVQINATTKGQSELFSKPVCATGAESKWSADDVHRGFVVLGDIASARGNLDVALGRVDLACDQIQFLVKAAIAATSSNTDSAEGPALTDQAAALILAATDAAGNDTATLERLMKLAKALPAPPPAAIVFRQWLPRQFDQYDADIESCTLPMTQGEVRRTGFAKQCSMSSANTKMIFDGLKYRMVATSIPIFASLESAKSIDDEEAALLKPLQILNQSTNFVGQWVAANTYDQSIDWRALIDKVDAFRATLANQHVDVCTLWVKLYQLQHGKPPPALGPELGDFRTDPYDNQMLTYVVKDGIASVADHAPKKLPPLNADESQGN